MHFWGGDVWGSSLPPPRLFLSPASSLGCRVSSGAQIPPLTPPQHRASPPQQEGFREGDKYQMGEGRAARNTLPACQELLARVGAWAGEGGGCPCSLRLLASFPRAQQPDKDRTIREGSATPLPFAPRGAQGKEHIPCGMRLPPPGAGAQPYCIPTRVSATPGRPPAQQWPGCSPSCQSCLAWLRAAA